MKKGSLVERALKQRGPRQYVRHEYTREELDLAWAYAMRQVTAKQAWAVLGRKKGSRQNIHQWAGGVLLNSARKGWLVKK